MQAPSWLCTSYQSREIARLGTSLSHASRGSGPPSSFSVLSSVRLATTYSASRSSTPTSWNTRSAWSSGGQHLRTISSGNGPYRCQGLRTVWVLMSCVLAAMWPALPSRYACRGSQLQASLSRSPNGRTMCHDPSMAVQLGAGSRPRGVGVFRYAPPLRIRPRTPGCTTGGPRFPARGHPARPSTKLATRCRPSCCNAAYSLWVTHVRSS